MPNRFHMQNCLACAHLATWQQLPRQSFWNTQICTYTRMHAGRIHNLVLAALYTLAEITRAGKKTASLWTDWQSRARKKKKKNSLPRFAMAASASNFAARGTPKTHPPLPPMERAALLLKKTWSTCFSIIASHPVTAKSHLPLLPFPKAEPQRHENTRCLFPAIARCKGAHVTYSSTKERAELPAVPQYAVVYIK